MTLCHEHESNLWCSRKRVILNLGGHRSSPEKLFVFHLMHKLLWWLNKAFKPIMLGLRRRRRGRRRKRRDEEELRDALDVE